MRPQCTIAAAAAELHVWLSDRDVIFVVGLYKTGTSLAVELCAKAGLVDPSRQTNPSEQGYGVSIPRYLTYECAVLRRLNEGWLRRSDALSTISPAEYYLLGCERPVVLKDPQFVLTLPRWVAAARRLGFRTGVLFACRPRRELAAAWEAAPMTRELLIRARLATYRAGLEEQMAWCRRNQVAHLQMSLVTLRRFKEATGFLESVTWKRRVRTVT